MSEMRTLYRADAHALRGYGEDQDLIEISTALLYFEDRAEAIARARTLPYGCVHECIQHIEGNVIMDEDTRFTWGTIMYNKARKAILGARKKKR